MELNELGMIVQEEWLRTREIRQNVKLDSFVVMPNHFHGILIFHEIVGATRPGSTNPFSGKVSLPNVTTDGIEGSPLLPRGPKPASNDCVGG
jgi:REP-associated tyrosine transposase